MDFMVDTKLPFLKSQNESILKYRKVLFLEGSHEAGKPERLHQQTCSKAQLMWKVQFDTHRLTFTS